MDPAKAKINISKRFLAATLLLLLTVHIVMGISLIILSKNALRKQIEGRMLDIANTAAYQLNGDDLKSFTAKDVGSEKYQKAYDTLKSFQKNIQLDYIYAVRAEADGTFTFMVDPDEKDPGEFGEKTVTTDALINASKGNPDVDKTPFTDEWGRFYSAYSPVFDSEGNIAAIVGVDFNAEWYDSMLNTHKAVVIILTMIVLTIAIAIVFISHANRLAGENVKYRTELTETLKREKEHANELGSALQLAYTDSLTGVKNKHAYSENIQRIDNGIENGTLKEFGVIVFDLNGLKNINDTLGHEAGDQYLKDGCALICRHFCHSPVFRIGGDEFVVLLEGSDYADREELLDLFDSRIDENLINGTVVVSTGLDIYIPGQDESFSNVFERADKKMYKRKKYLKCRK